MQTESRRIFLVCPKCGIPTPYVYTFTKAKQRILEKRAIKCEKCKDDLQVQLDLQSGYVKVV